jgi:signal transduction histidine kinase
VSAPTRPAPHGVDHPSLVPAQLLAAADLAPVAGETAGRVRRSVRDWVVDVVAFLLAVCTGLVAVGLGAESATPPDGLLAADLSLGLLGCVALWWRRRWPVAIALGLAVLGTFSDMAGGAVLFALFTVAVHRRWPTVLVVSAANVVSFAVYITVRPVAGVPTWIFAVIGLVLTAAVVAWGMFVRARRQLVQSLRDRADRAEAEQRLRVAQAQQLERTRIAREMHDVLAHRLSLLSMHAGALEFRPDAPPAEVARAAGVVRASARQALEDLREVIGVLRDAPDGPSSTHPQPTLADLPALLEESRAAGLRIRAELDVPDAAAVPPALGRNAYRVVQEALTNVRKHAPGAVATVRVGGAPGTGLTIVVRNPRSAGEEHAAPLPSAGTGLVGLGERIGLAGGRLEHGWTGDGDFLLSAWLPWPAAPATAGEVR